jgi:hypothetical protein
MSTHPHPLRDKRRIAICIALPSGTKIGSTKNSNNIGWFSKIRTTLFPPIFDTLSKC